MSKRKSSPIHSVLAMWKFLRLKLLRRIFLCSYLRALRVDLAILLSNFYSVIKVLVLIIENIAFIFSYCMEDYCLKEK